MNTALSWRRYFLKSHKAHIRLPVSLAQSNNGKSTEMPTRSTSKCKEYFHIVAIYCPCILVCICIKDITQHLIKRRYWHWHRKRFFEICIVYLRLTMPQFNLLVLYLYCDIFLFHFVFYRSQGPPQYGNIMYDRRIVRGNTYAQHTLPAVRTSSFISMILLLS